MAYVGRTIRLRRGFGDYEGDSGDVITSPVPMPDFTPAPVYVPPPDVYTAPQMTPPSASATDFFTSLLRGVVQFKTAQAQPTPGFTPAQARQPIPGFTRPLYQGQVSRPYSAPKNTMLYIGLAVAVVGVILFMQRK